MSRACTTCQHLKRPEIDRRLAAGEPTAQVARDYELNVSSLHRHRTNCLTLGSSNAIMKDVARGTAAAALLPSKETLSGAYFELRERIDQIVAQAQHEGSLSVAVSGLNSIRQTLDSLTATVDGRVAATGAVFEAKFMLPWSCTEEGARDRAGGAPRSPTRSSRAAPANRHRQPGFCKAIGWRTGSACSSGRRRNLNLVRRIRNGSVEPYSLSWGIAESRGSIAEDG